MPPGRGADHEGRVGHPGRHDDVGARLQRGGDAPSAEIGVGGHRLHAQLGELASGVEVDERLAGRLQLVDAAHEIVTGDVGDAGGEPKARGELGHLLGQATGVEAAGVSDDLDAAFQAGGQHLLKLGEEGAGVPGLGVATPGLPQDQHRQLGEVVAGQHVDRATVDHLLRGVDTVPVETRAVGDAYRTPLCGRCGHVRHHPSCEADGTADEGVAEGIAVTGAAHRGDAPGPAARRRPGRSRGSGPRWPRWPAGRGPRGGDAG